jgi:hypothetical protein
MDSVRNQALEEAAQVVESGEVFGLDQFVKFVTEYKKSLAKRIRALKSNEV